MSRTADKPGQSGNNEQSAHDSLQRRSRMAGAGLLVMAAAVLAFNVAWVAGNAEQLEPVSSGDRAPGFVLPAIDSDGRLVPNAVDSRALQGKVVLLDFWATWCKPCRRSLPALDRVYKRYRDDGLQVISINTDDPQAGRAMFDSMGISLPLYFDDGVVAGRFQVSSIPHLVVLDEHGTIRHVHRGFQGEDVLDAQIHELVRSH